MRGFPEIIFLFTINHELFLMQWTMKPLDLALHLHYQGVNQLV